MSIPVNFVTVHLLGTDRSHDCNVKALFVSGATRSLKFFTDESEYFVFRDQLSDLKNLIATLNYQHRQGLLSDAEYQHRLRNDWLLDACMAFIRAFGRTSVPADVRAAIDEVSTELDTKIVNAWPPIVMYQQYRHNDVDGVFHMHFIA